MGQILFVFFSIFCSTVPHRLIINKHLSQTKGTLKNMIRSTYLLTIVMLFGKKQSFVMDENETIILYGTLLTFVMVFTKCL